MDTGGDLPLGWHRHATDDNHHLHLHFHLSLFGSLLCDRGFVAILLQFSNICNDDVYSCFIKKKVTNPLEF